MNGVAGRARVEFSDAEIEPDAVRRMFGKNALGLAPGPRRRAVHGGIGIENPAEVGIHRVSAFLRGQHAEEILGEAGMESRQHAEEPTFDFLAGAEESRAQHDAGDAAGMCLRIGQRQRRAPGAADDHPALNAEFLADHLHVRDQMRQRVVFASPLGPAAAGAALVEQHRVKALGIEQPAMIGLAAAAGTAVQIDRGDAVGAADGFDIDLVAVADRQQLGGQRCEGIGAVASGFARIGVRRHGRRRSRAFPRRNCDR